MKYFTISYSDSCNKCYILDNVLQHALIDFIKSFMRLSYININLLTPCKQLKLKILFEPKYNKYLLQVQLCRDLYKNTTTCLCTLCSVLSPSLFFLMFLLLSIGQVQLTSLFNENSLI